MPDVLRGATIHKTAVPGTDRCFEVEFIRILVAGLGQVAFDAGHCIRRDTLLNAIFLDLGIVGLGPGHRHGAGQNQADNQQA